MRAADHSHPARWAFRVLGASRRQLAAGKAAALRECLMHASNYPFAATSSGWSESGH